MRHFLFSCLFGALVGFRDGALVSFIFSLVLVGFFKLGRLLFAGRSFPPLVGFVFGTSTGRGLGFCLGFGGGAGIDDVFKSFSLFFTFLSSFFASTKV